MNKKNITVEGIVLKKFDYKEADEIITVFSKELGKVKFFAKGVRKISSKRQPHLQTGNFVVCNLNKVGEMFFVQSTFLRSGLSTLKSSEKGVEYMYRFCFLLDRLLPELEQEESVYFLTLDFFKDLARNVSFDNYLLNSYMANLLMLLGHGVDYNYQGDLSLYTEQIINEKIPLQILN
jgi:DNA repair protein RecO (recombination protein O)